MGIMSRACAIVRVVEAQGIQAVFLETKSRLTVAVRIPGREGIKGLEVEKEPRGFVPVIL